MDDQLKETLDRLGQDLIQLCGSQSDKIIQQSHKCALISQLTGFFIIFERFIPETDGFLFYAYDKNTKLMVLQQHYKIMDDTLYPEKYSQYAFEFIGALLQMYPRAYIHFINYADAINSDPRWSHRAQSIINMAISLIDKSYYPCNKLILHVHNYVGINLSGEHISQQISDGSHILHKMEPSMYCIVKDLQLYQEFTKDETIKAITQNQIYCQEIIQTELAIKESRLTALILMCRLCDNIPYMDSYISTIIINLAKYQQIDPEKIILKLRKKLIQKNTQLCYTKQDNPSKLIIRRKLAELPLIFEQRLWLFKNPQHRHFPEKSTNSMKCKVCQRQSKQEVKKSSYRCEGCRQQYDINITLCALKCFKLFHCNPDMYLTRRTKKVCLQYNE